MRSSWYVAGLLGLLLNVGCGGDSKGAGASNVTSLPQGATFTDPQGKYTMVISPDWSEITATANEVEKWTISPIQGGFDANVNVLAEDAPGVNLDSYLDTNAREMESRLGFTIVDKKTVRGANGTKLGLVESSGKLSDHPLRILSVVAVRDGRAIVATLAAEPSTFDADRARVEPYFLTLKAT